MRKILVTGASGFIGSNLVETLLKEGHTIIGMDNDPDKQYLLNDVIPKKARKSEIGLRIEQIDYVSKDFTMIWDDINNMRQYYYAMDDVDEIYHLAASADIRKSFSDPTMDLKNNVQGTNEVLELMRLKDIERLIFSSSSSIYGVTKITPTPEDVPDIRPISMYGASKLANEAFINAYSDLYGIKAWMFRFANVVGRHMHRGVIHDLYEKLKVNQKELEILGDGNQEKSYFDVSDCIAGLMELPKKDKNKSVEIYNLGNIKTIRVIELAQILCHELDLQPKFKFTGGNKGWPGDTPYTILSINKALCQGWKPRYSCEQSIIRTVEYLREREKR